MNVAPTPQDQVQLDRRDATRYSVNVTLRYVTHEEQDAQLSTLGMAETLDVSASGLRLQTTGPVKVPSFLQVAISLRDRTMPIILLAKAVWSNPEPDGKHTAGVRFLGHVDPEFLRYVDSLED